MSLKCHTSGERIEVTVSGPLTTDELAQIWGQFDGRSKCAVLNLTAMTGFLSFQSLLRASERLKAAGAVRFAFVAGNLVTYGCARMLISTFQLTDYDIFKTVDEAVAWVSRIS